MLLGSTAVIRLKSPLAHVSYSSGSKVRPPDQKKGKNWPTLSFVCAATLDSQDAGVGERFNEAKSGHKGLHNVRGKTPPESNRRLPLPLSPAVVNRSASLWMKWVTPRFWNHTGVIIHRADPSYLLVFPSPRVSQ